MCAVSLIDAGVAHGAWENDVVALRGMREIFDYLPLNNKDTPEPKPTQDSRYRLESALRWVLKPVQLVTPQGYTCVLVAAGRWLVITTRGS
jgi:acetyl-CoA carboxylase carboxyltransferase component